MEQEHIRTRLIEEAFDKHIDKIMDSLVYGKRPYYLVPVLPEFTLTGYDVDLDVPLEVNHLEFKIYWHDTIMGQVYVIMCEGREVYQGYKTMEVKHDSTQL